ncbi:Orcokinin peptides type B [Armadillidium nasatum]|uniref:Orcokinin peptides type B n=1 Tax=Armadillidium nasatum TaxID=96803 RepID=A0A5N5T4B1_9CRUS|nr:Orcokinin peptides type B [Armadillidium nasatum]
MYTLVNPYLSIHTVTYRRLFLYNIKNGFGESKRSFDEISRSSFGFNKRRDFDEIGRSSFGFNKRRNFDEIGRSSFGFAKKNDMRNSFDTGSDVTNELDMMKRGDFDEIGRSSFGFYRRSPQAPRSSGWRFFSGFGKRNPSNNFAEKDVEDKRFDEINRSAFGFSRLH